MNLVTLYLFCTVQKLWDFNFLQGLAPVLLDGFGSEGSRRSANLSTFLLRSLKADQCNFLGESRSGAGALSKHGFRPCPFIIRSNNR